MKFSEQFFQKMNFSPDQIQQFFDSASHDLNIARDSNIPDVVFKFSYDALIKIGIAVIAKSNHRVRSTTGHHIKIIEKMSQILDDEDVGIFGNRMRRERNQNLYDGIIAISRKESKECFLFVDNVFKKAKKVLETTENKLGYKKRGINLRTKP